MTRIFSWLIKKFLSQKAAKSDSVSFSVGEYSPFTHFLVVIKAECSVPHIHTEKISACQTCGACCAFFIVAFPTSELNSEIGGMVPEGMTLPLDNLRSYMKGTKSKTRRCRCNALEGVVGHNVCCTIYENRPSSCRNFSRSWSANKGNELCDKARLAYGLQSFSKY